MESFVNEKRSKGGSRGVKWWGLVENEPDLFWGFTIETKV